MAEWRVDPDGVLGVLAGVDEQGLELVSAHDALDAAAADGGSTLSIDGRTTLSQAWDEFMSSRRLIPGKLMYVLKNSSAAVSDATVAVVTGDDQMSDDLSSAQQHAQDAWNIAPEHAYLSVPAYW